MPAPLEQEMLRRVPRGMGAANAGYQPSPMEEISMMDGLGEMPEMMRGEVMGGPKGMLGIAKLLQAMKEKGTPIAADVFTRGLQNQSTRGSLLSPEHLRFLRETIFNQAPK